MSNATWRPGTALISRHGVGGLECNMDGFGLKIEVAKATVEKTDVIGMTVENTQDIIEAKVTILNRLGLHARPAMAFVDVANGFAADIKVRKGDQVVDGKSIMQMMMLAATQGTELMISAAGADGASAIQALKDLIDRKFDED